MLHRFGISATLTMSLAAAAASSVPMAAPADGSLEVSVSQGYDSNPLELNPQALIEPFHASGGSYTRLDLDARLSHAWNPRIGYFLSARGQDRLFPSRIEEAESVTGKVEAGLGFVLFARGDRKLSAAVSASYGTDRNTFVDPATGKMYVTLSDPNTLAPIPDRFDANISELSLDLRFRTSRNLLFTLDSSFEQQDYIEDYENVPTLQSLDDRSLTVRPGLRWQMSDRIRLDVTAEWNDRRYDGLSALEEDSTLAVGTRRRYRTQGLRAVMRVTPADGLTFQVGVGGADRSDLHAGYYDSIGVNGFVAAAWSVTPNVRLAMNVTEVMVDYDRATLDFIPNGERRGGELLRAAASVERDLGDHVTLFGEAGAARSANVDPLYEYDRNWAHAGVRYKL